MIVIRNRTLRRVLNLSLPFFVIPVIILLGVFVFDDKRYAFIAAGVAAATILFFLTGFEQKRVGTRRLIIAAVLIALSVVGRFIPFFKPMTAITVIAAIWLGGETGFLVGSFSMLISNFYFGHGPWTPFQMFSLGLIALLAAALAKPLKKYKWALIIFGVVSGVIYSEIMNVWTVLWYTNEPSMALYLTAMTTSLPHTILYAVSNTLFLLLLGRPFGEKLDRIKLKYGV